MANSVLNAEIDALAAALEHCLRCDRETLGQQLARLRRTVPRASECAGAASGAPLRQRLARLAERAARSRAVRAERAALTPRLECPAELPIAAHWAALSRLIAAHQVVIVSGATGSGKSTQLPKLCLAAGRGIDGRIGHTQPRRIAARAIAARVAAETGTAAGEVVGHCVRFDDNLAPHTRVKVMTDGILLNEIHTDRALDEYDTLIIDEVHERTLNVDFLLGYLKQLLPRRPDLKLIITSATLDVGAFSAFFDGAACFAIPGRTYPVETRYRPRGDDDEADLNDAISAAIAELDAVARGDVLVFLPGEREIREAAAHLRRAPPAATEVLQLFGRLSASRQARIFAPGPLRRVILTTNVAETSLTVPRVRHVIDSGLARVSRYSPRRKLQQLPIEKIARANADQRQGRCGREAPGICVRLYGEADYQARRASIEPEIQRTHLAGVVLRLKALGVGELERFPFLERPAERLIKDGHAVLQEIGALDRARAITPLGAALADYPLDPRLGRVLLAADGFGCLDEALVIVAALAIVDPRERPHELREAADRAHARFADKRSDFLWYTNAWSFACEVRALPQRKQLRRCRRAFLSAVRLREWVELHDYLTRRARRNGLRPGRGPAGYKQVHMALLTGFPTLVAEWQGDHYAGCRNASFGLHPGSALARRGVRWILAGDVVETARPHARLAARIDPAWVEQAADHLIKRSYDAPHWDARLGCARVTEIQRLFGLVLRADRVVDLARVEPGAARALLIECGLLDAELGEIPPFLQHNRALVAQVQELEARARRRDLLAPRAQLAAFYAARLPQEIASRRALLRWLRADPERDRRLRMQPEDVNTEHVRSLPGYLFPDALDIDGTRCPLRYHFEPGHGHDGITVTLPLALLPRLEAEHLDRLVPGLLSEKIEQLLRNLPKAERRRFSPLREFAMAALEAARSRAGPLPEVLAATLARMTGHEVRSSLFDESRLDQHLRCRIELVDIDGRRVAVGRDVGALREAREPAARAARDAVEWPLGGRSSGGWTFPSVPACVAAAVGDNRLRGFPALVDCGEAVELAVYDTPEQAARVHAGGVARLLLLGAARELREIERTQCEPTLALHALRFEFHTAPVVYVAAACARRWVAARAPVRDAAAFEALRAAFVGALPAEIAARVARLEALWQRGGAVRERVEACAAEVPPATFADLRSQLGRLLGPAVIAAIDRDGAARHDRYLDAIERRLERVLANPGKDLKKLELLAPLWQSFLGVSAPHDEAERAVGELHVLIEEYRISLFAPELGTACKVSAERVRSGLEEIAGAA